MTARVCRTAITAEFIRGALDLEPTADGVIPHRLPAWARRQFDDGQLAMAESQPSGVRIVFRTASDHVELTTRPTKITYVGAPPRPDGVYDLVIDGQLADQTAAAAGNVLTIDLATGGSTLMPGPVATCRFDGLSSRMKDVELWLPHTETTELIELRTDAPVEPIEHGLRPTWLHHGSSISHGSNAASPSGTWPAVAASHGNVELTNLGFGGSALLDPFVARTMRDTPADLISLKLGINLVNTDVMRLRAFVPAVHGFLDTIREGHPATPLVLVSPIWCAIHEQTPGPTALNLSEGRVRFTATGESSDTATGKLTLQVIRRALRQIVDQRAADDPNLCYLDGLALYGEADAEQLPLPDDLHPDAATHRLIGTRFADAVLTGVLGVLGVAASGHGQD